MFRSIIAYIFDMKAIKTTVASAVGSGAVVISIVDAKMSEVKTITEKDKTFVVEYVNSRHERALEKIDVLLQTQQDIKSRLEKIDDRLFNINKKLKE